ncbi:hypothetical protein [Streptomyces sp. NBC_01565]|uniref:hypothetical protein n=1 Tax=Streptomyces sp. NBC_01565 TaxID=2975881 RepID=UPI002251790E|nr:hypothetical protein [Streptomyces sp. NBC_01565]MCX4543807.1 hypothetical protein [Streptomyces sp. NBC_01565]
MNESTSCVICSRDLWQDESDRLACRPCERRIDDRLRSIAGPRGLFARLCLRNEVGAPSAEPRVSGSASASIAGSLNILNETSDGGFVSFLEEWVADWAAEGIGVCGTGVRPQYRVDQAIANLRFNLATACRKYPGIAAFAAEINSYCRRYEAIIDGGPPPVQVPTTCVSCGKGFRHDLFADVAPCPHCGHEHSRAQLLQPDASAA